MSGGREDMGVSIRATPRSVGAVQPVAASTVRAKSTAHGGKSGRMDALRNVNVNESPKA
jgi:hypothetical protein